MDIAALSVVKSQGKVQQQAGLSVLKMAMGVASDNGQAIAELARAAQPHLGGNLDIQA